MIFDKNELIETIEEGVAGNAVNAPIGFKKLEAGGVKLFPKCYTLIGGFPGSGKSAFLHDAYILNPYEWWKHQKETVGTDLEFYWLLWSMERPLLELKLKWVARRVFQITKKLKEPILLDVAFLKGFKSSKVTPEIKKIVFDTFDYMEEMFSYIEVKAATNPTGVYKEVKNYALKVGTIEETPYVTRDGITKTTKTYKKNNPKRITVIGIDHLGKLNGETVEGVYLKPESRELIQRMSMFCSSEFRDFYGFSPIIVGQFNRNIENSARFGSGKDSVIPQPSDFKNSATPFEDSDTVLALFNPHKIGLDEFPTNGYKMNKLILPDGENRFRALTVLKNSYGVDDVTYGLGFLGGIGKFTELKKPSEMKDIDYFNIMNIKKVY
mgnify:CR=1 FL=1